MRQLGDFLLLAAKLFSIFVLYVIVVGLIWSICKINGYTLAAIIIEILFDIGGAILMCYIMHRLMD